MGMAHVTFISRSMDGLILSETWDDDNKVSPQLRSHAKQVLENLRLMPARGLVDGGSGCVFHYKIADGVCYMGIFDTGYPNNLAFAFIEEIHMLFQEELMKEFGTGSADHRSRIETIEKPYYFIKFERYIKKKKIEYRDSSSSKALGKLNANLVQVSGMMKQNIEQPLERGDKLEDVGRKAANLKYASHDYKGTARMLNVQSLLQKHAIPVMVVLVFLIIICFKLIKR